MKGFVQSCKIAKDTPELRKKLEHIGICLHPTFRSDKFITSGKLYVNRGFFGCIPIGYIDELNNIVDCGENEDLFLAIAALNYNTDKFQWFYSTGWTDYQGNPIKDKWVYCDQDTLEQFAWVNNSPNSYKSGWKKANVKELINHFGKDE